MFDITTSPSFQFQELIMAPLLGKYVSIWLSLPLVPLIDATIVETFPSAPVITLTTSVGAIGTNDPAAFIVPTRLCVITLLSLVYVDAIVTNASGSLPGESFRPPGAVFPGAGSGIPNRLAMIDPISGLDGSCTLLLPAPGSWGPVSPLEGIWGLEGLFPSPPASDEGSSEGSAGSFGSLMAGEAGPVGSGIIICVLAGRGFHIDNFELADRVVNTGSVGKGAGGPIDIAACGVRATVNAVIRPTLPLKCGKQLTRRIKNTKLDPHIRVFPMTSPPLGFKAIDFLGNSKNRMVRITNG